MGGGHETVGLFTCEVRGEESPEEVSGKKVVLCVTIARSRHTSHGTIGITMVRGTILKLQWNN